MGDELVFVADLCIVGRFKLTILHVVHFHPHEHYIGIGPTITVAISQYFLLLLIFLQSGQIVLFKIPQLFNGGFIHSFEPGIDRFDLFLQLDTINGPADLLMP